MLKRFLAWLSHYDWPAIIGSALVAIFLVFVLVPTITLVSTTTHKQPQQHCYKATDTKGIYQEIECESFWIRSTNDPIAIFTLVLACFTLVLAGASIWQGRLTQQTIKLAQQEFAATNRPNIAMLSLETEDWDLGPDKRGDTIVGMAVRLRFVNVGTSRAIVKEIWARILDAPPTHDTVFLQTNIAEGTLEMGERGSQYTSPRPFPGMDHALFNEPIYCAGRFLYTDIAGHWREMGFCYKASNIANWERVRDSPFDYSF
jgi:hypothetical protein